MLVKKNFNAVFIIADDVIQANELLNEVNANYHRFVDEMKTKSKISKKEVQTTNGDSLLDFAGANTSRCEGDKPKTKGNNAVIDELGDIFSSESSTSNIAEPMKPVNLMSSGKNIRKKKKQYIITLL